MDHIDEVKNSTVGIEAVTYEVDDVNSEEVVIELNPTDDIDSMTSDTSRSDFSNSGNSKETITSVEVLWRERVNEVTLNKEDSNNNESQEVHVNAKMAESTANTSHSSVSELEHLPKTQTVENLSESNFSSESEHTPLLFLPKHPQLQLELPQAKK